MAKVGVFMLVLAVGFVVAVLWRPWESSGPQDQSALIAGKIGNGATCTAESYALVNKADGSKEWIYDCTAGTGKRMCVTYQGGIASDSTAVVRIVFANALGNARPGCLS